MEHPTFPADPFGIHAAGQSALEAFRDSGALGALERSLTHAGPEGPRWAARERQATEDLIAGRRPQARSMVSVHSLGHLLVAAEREGLDIAPVQQALGAWRAAYLPPMEYMTGRCHEFAVAGSIRMGWPIAVVSNESNAAQHVVLLHPDGTSCVDAMGQRPLTEVLDWYGAAQEDVVPVTVEGALSWPGLPHPKDLAAAAAYFAQVVGLPPPLDADIPQTPEAQLPLGGLRR